MIRVNDILREKGLMKKEFCEMLGVTPQTIGGQLKGKVQLATLEKMATVLDVPLWQLFASPEEVKHDLGIDTSSDEIAEATTVCPHCHKPIKVTFSK